MTAKRKQRHGRRAQNSAKSARRSEATGKPFEPGAANHGKPFGKGKSGNPGGRPKSADFCAEVRDFLRARDPKRKDHKAMLVTVLERLSKGDPKILLYYAFGKPQETVEHAGRVKLEHEYDLRKLTVDQLIALKAAMDAAQVTATPP